MKIKGIEISHPDKILFPQAELTKKDVADYYAKIAGNLLKFGKSRPLTFKIFPDGVNEPGFFQKNMPEYYPGAIPRLEVPTRSKDKSNITMTAAKKAEDLVYFSGQNVIELHAALSTGDALEEPERMVFDFDPSEDDFGKVRQLVRTFKRILDAADITAFVSTTGSRGLHVHVPLRPGAQFQQSKSVAKALAQKLHGAEPEISTLEQRKSKRGNKVFIDTLRNAYGQTFILPYSLRAQKQAPVATPVRWDELDSSDFSAQSYTLANILQRLSQVENPWKNYARSRQSIDSLISKTN